MAIRCDGGICGHNGCIVTPGDRDNPPRESSVAANRAPRRNREWWRPVLAGSRGSNINGDNGVAAAPDAVGIVENTAADTARAVGNTDFMIGADSYARSAGIRIARVTAPVNNKISA